MRTVFIHDLYTHVSELFHHTVRKQSDHGPLVRYVKLRAEHAPGMTGTFYPPPTSKETAS